VTAARAAQASLRVAPVAVKVARVAARKVVQVGSPAAAEVAKADLEAVRKTAGMAGMSWGQEVR